MTSSPRNRFVHGQERLYSTLMPTVNTNETEMFFVMYIGGTGGDFFQCLSKTLLKGALACDSFDKVARTDSRTGQVLERVSMVKNYRRFNSWLNMLPMDTTAERFVSMMVNNCLPKNYHHLLNEYKDQKKWLIQAWHPHDDIRDYDEQFDLLEHMFPHHQLIFLDPTTADGHRWGQMYDKLSQANVVNPRRGPLPTYPTGITKQVHKLKNGRLFDIGMYTRNNFDEVLEWFAPYETHNHDEARQLFDNYVQTRITAYEAL